MSKKKPEAQPAPKPCPVCHDNGYFCGECGRAVGDCTCLDGPDEQECQECKR